VAVEVAVEETKMALTNYQLSLDGAQWVDVNPQYGQNNLPDRLSDGYAISDCSLFGLLNCMPGQRSRTFQPEYGSIWLQFIHEQPGPTTALKMETFMISAIEKWEPRITLDKTNTRIVYAPDLPGYVVRIAYSLPQGVSSKQIQFNLPL
jgi:phage baseplate assembly protein W